VILTFDPQERAAARLRDAENGDEIGVHNRRNYEFMLEHWRVTRPIVSGEYLTDSFEVECDQFDRETRTCHAQDNKPPICDGYPWYGRDEDDHEGRQPVADQLSPRCSFNADVPGRTFLRIVEVT
jgi:Fe-S-cluster containining protein